VPLTVPAHRPPPAGGLYAYHTSGGINVGLEKLPISLPELVDAAPSLTGDGSVVLGNRQTTLYVLERSSGRLLHVMSNAAAGMEDTAALGARQGLPVRRPVATGAAGCPRRRHAHHLRARRPAARSSSAQPRPASAHPSPLLLCACPAGLPLRELGEKLLFVGRQDFAVRSVNLETGARPPAACGSSTLQQPRAPACSAKLAPAPGSGRVPALPAPAAAQPAARSLRSRRPHLCPSVGAELWNATFGKLRLLPAAPRGSSGSDPVGQFLKGGAASAGGCAAAPTCACACTCACAGTRGDQQHARM
jgi:hypothetical protein